MRKDLGEGKQEENKPENGEEDSPKKPRDPKDPRDGENEPPEGEAGNGQQNNVPAWQVGLPPQIRDAFIRGDFESLPEKYRKLVPMYLRWLQTEESRQR